MLPQPAIEGGGVFSTCHHLVLFSRAMSKLARFLDGSPKALRRRYERQRRRAACPDKYKPRARARQNSSRRTRLPCCGLERRSCNCAQDVSHLFDVRALKQMFAAIRQSSVRTVRDPKDMAFIITELNGSRMSLRSLLFQAILFRMHSNPAVYLVLAQHVRASSPDDAPPWCFLEQELRGLYRNGDSVWGGMFYPSTLRRAKVGTGRWRNCISRGGAPQPALQAQRDVCALRVVWAALQENKALRAYEADRARLSAKCNAATCSRARHSFAKFYDSFFAAVRVRVRGWWGDYAMKCFLDVPCNLSLAQFNDRHTVFPDMVLSRWPINCPGYAKALKGLLKPKVRSRRMSAGMKTKLLMHVHRVMSRELGAQHHSLSSTLAQLCWQKRARS